MYKFNSAFKSLLKEADSNNGIIDGSVSLDHLYLRELPEFFKDLTIDGDFSCSHNKITSLKNCPKIINGSFSFTGNNISSLDGMPTDIGGFCILSDNNLTSLDGLSQTLHRLHGISFRKNKLTNLNGLNMDVVYSVFNISENRLTSLKGCPNIVYGYVYVNDNLLTSLDGISKTIDGNLSCYGNPVVFSIEYINEITYVDGDIYNTDAAF